MNIRIYRNDKRDAIIFLLILFAFLALGSIEIPACADRISRHEARWEQATRGITQDIPSLKVSDQK